MAAVVYDEPGSIMLWWYRSAAQMTCNEAEYAAAIFALDQLIPFRPLALTICSDSQVMVRQMRGEAAVRSPALRGLHQALRERVIQYDQVIFQHVAREENRVADALANEAILRELRGKGGQVIPCAANRRSSIPIFGK